MNCSWTLHDGHVLVQAAARDELLPAEKGEMERTDLLIYPKVKQYARTPGSRKVISKVRSVMGPVWRMSWYTR